MTVLLDEEIKDPIIGYVLGTKESIVSLIYKKLKKAEKHRDKLADGKHRCYEIYGLVELDDNDLDKFKYIDDKSKTVKFKLTK